MKSPLMHSQRGMFGLIGKAIVTATCLFGLGLWLFVPAAAAQTNDDQLAESRRLEREAALYRRWAEELRKTAQGWRADAAQMRKIAEQHNNDKVARETADYYDRRAAEIEAEADRLAKQADAKTRGAHQAKPVADISGFWQEGSGRFTVQIIQSGSDVAMDLGNGIVLRGKLTGRDLTLRYKWTAEDAAKHIKSENESGPKGAADREAALQALAGKVVTLSGTVSQNEDSIRGTYDESFESDAETSATAGTTVHAGQPFKAPITLSKKRAQAHCVSETLATVPANRARTRIGVGEEVKLTFRTGSNQPAVATWRANGSGNLSSNSGAEVTFTAGDRAGTTVITARSAAGESCSVLLTVVEPENVIVQMVPGSEYHVKGHMSAGFLGKWVVTPSDVSFSKIELRELDALAPAIGELAPANDSSHGPNPAFAAMGATVEGLGTPMAEGHVDQIAVKVEKSFFGVVNDPIKDGVAAFRIPYEYRVGATGTPKTFTHVIQLIVAKQGVCTISKGGVSVTKKNDDETTPSWQQFGLNDPR
jgi:hypothetical protein